MAFRAFLVFLSNRPGVKIVALRRSRRRTVLGHPKDFFLLRRSGQGVDGGVFQQGHLFQEDRGIDLFGKKDVANVMVEGGVGIKDYLVGDAKGFQVRIVGHREVIFPARYATLASSNPRRRSRERAPVSVRIREERSSFHPVEVQEPVPSPWLPRTGKPEGNGLPNFIPWDVRLLDVVGQESSRRYRRPVLSKVYGGRASRLFPAAALGIERPSAEIRQRRLPLSAAAIGLGRLAK